MRKETVRIAKEIYQKTNQTDKAQEGIVMEIVNGLNKKG